MKTFVNKLLKLVLLLSLFFAFYSCNNVNNQETLLEQKQNDQKEQKDAPILQICIKDIDTVNARTVLPVAPDVNDLTDISVTFRDSSNINNQTVFGPYESVDTLQNLKLPLEFLGKEYHIELGAYKGDSFFYGYVFDFTVEKGVNKLEFNLYLNDYGIKKGKYGGSFTYKIDYSGASNKGDVKYVEAKIVNASGNTFSREYSFGSEDLKNYSVTITDSLPAGYYYILVSFYANTSKSDIVLLTDVPWREVLHIASGLKSEKTQVITDFNTMCHITYDLNLTKYGIDSSATVNFEPLNIIHKKTSSDAINKPSINGYYFLGWYTDADCKFKCSKYINSDITLYACWVNLNPTDGSKIAFADDCNSVIESNANGTSSNPVVIRVVGEIEQNTMNIISSALINNSSSYYALDFTDAFGVTSIDDNKFSYCTNLVGITLNDEITRIGSNAFFNCNCLKEITIGRYVYEIGTCAFSNCYFTKFTLDSNNQYFAYIDGVLYEKKNNVCKRAIVYPVKSAVNNVTIPDTVTTIDAYAFSGAENLNNITFADTSNFWIHRAQEVTSNTYESWTELFLSSNYESNNVFRISNADGSATIADALSNRYKEHYYYKFDMQYFKESATDVTSKVTTDEPVKTGQTTCDGVDIDVIKYDSTFVDVITTKNTEVYRVDNAKGKKYRIYWLDAQNTSESYGYYSDYPTTGLEDRHINIYDGTGKYIWSTDDKPPFFDFTSATDTFFIIPERGNNGLGCAFRIWQSKTIETTLANAANIIAEASISDNGYGSSSNPIILKISGDYDKTQFENIARELENKRYNHKKECFSFDFSGINNLEIGDNVFNGRNNIITVTFGDNSSLKSIGMGAFCACDNLTSVTISDKVEKIDKNAFAGCTALKNVTFGENSVLEFIQSKVFWLCTALTSISIPANVKILGDGIFEDCAENLSITLPDNGDWYYAYYYAKESEEDIKAKWTKYNPNTESFITVNKDNYFYKIAN